MRSVTVVLLVLLAGPDAQSGQRPVVAVFDLNVQRIQLAGSQRDMLTRLLAEEMGVGGLFQVMPPGDVRQALQAQSSESYRDCYDEQCQVRLGRQLPANKLLTSTLRMIGQRCRLTGTLYDLGRQTTDIVAREESGCQEAELVRSVEKVAAKIRSWGGGAAMEEGSGEKTASDWEAAGGQEVIVRFTSQPGDAVVLVDGEVVCNATPCSRGLTIGWHTLAMKAVKHSMRRERVQVAAGTKIDWTLDPDFGYLTVHSEPSGLDLLVNDQPAGTTPIEHQERESGVYQVRIRSRCHRESGVKVRVERGQERRIELAPESRRGAIRLSARDAKDDDVAADVYVDGERLGRTPGTFQVSVCARKLELTHKKHGMARRDLEIVEHEVLPITVMLEGGGGGLVWEHSPEAGIELSRSEVTVAQYRACVEAGSCSEPRSKSENRYCNWGRPDRDRHPVNCVSWHQAEAFCKWAGGWLPTAQEWYAVASGAGQRKYPWGDERASCALAVMAEGGDGCGADATWPVCSMPSGHSPGGLCDMSGNVWEWTSDSLGEDRVICGGSWLNRDPAELRASSRRRHHKMHKDCFVGFRCARSPD
ncbi:MAG: formylglycine-generating enzyme family protein [Deltaproteobacteria bacterium]|nr:formylglycine-generating enzyme family protein [Deltaproteobacteria bacterium]